MKRVFALILALCLLGTLCACGGGNTDTTPETTLAPAVKTNVAEPLTWEKINAMPIANDSMTEEELRQLCLDFMDLQMQFPWTPSQTTNMINVEKNPENVVKTFSKGMVYGGTPYLTAKCSNLYSMMEFYDERNGMLDLSGGQDTLNMIGNQCSSSTFWAWNRVCASANHSTTANILEKNGCLRVGPYKYAGDPENNGWEGYYGAGCGTDLVCQQNGMQVMFQSYALVEPADGIVSSTQAHVQMIAGYPNVVKDAAGNIDGLKSTVTYTDQDGQYYPSTQSDGSPYEHVGGNHVEVTFMDLFMKHYIPFTFAELNKEKEVEKSETTIDISGESVTLYQLSLATVTSNYSISDLTVVIKDANGNQVFRKLTNIHDTSPNHRTASVGVAATAMDLSKYADGKHTIEISARIGTGEKPVVYTGTLTN